MSIYEKTNSRPVEMLPGLTRRTLVSGESMMICEFTFLENVQIPTHSHRNEQVGYIISGRLRMNIGGEVSELGPGDSYNAPANVPHSALSLAKTVLIDIFSPPREDYRELPA